MQENGLKIDQTHLFMSSSQNVFISKGFDEKILSIISHQGDTNKTHNEIALHTHKWLKLKSQIINVAENMRNMEPSYTTDGNEKWCRHFGNQPGTSSEC